ncbi:MAG: DUF4845 domain-containing protein [Steroidobacteraceae bacterium]
MRRERGITLIGWLFLLTPLAICLYAGIRLAPVYLNYLKVARTLQTLTSQFNSGGASEFAIENSISRHFEINSVSYPTLRDIAITRVPGGWRVVAAYYDYAPLFGNITLRVAFDKSVIVHRSG